MRVHILLILITNHGGKDLINKQSFYDHENGGNRMKNKLLFFVLNTLYSILGWLLCIIQIGSSMISNYNQYLTLILAVLHLSVGVFVNLFLYLLIKNKKNLKKVENHKKHLLIGYAIITLPYFLITLLWIVGWF